MANENDELQSQNREDNKFNNQLLPSSSDTAVGVMEKTVGGDGADDCARLEQPNLLIEPEEEREDSEDLIERNATGGLKGTLNDLVADLYLSGLTNGAVRTTQQGAGEQTAGNDLTHISYGDYKNIRATVGQGGVSNDALASSSINTPAPSHTQNTFSFKHFLSSGASSLQAPSSTVTSLDVPLISATAPVTASINSAVTTSLQSSTGARPKVPQSSSFSASATNTSLTSSLNPSGSASNESTASCTNPARMKRSPRFSSFDSQASLAGAAANSEENETAANSSSSSGGFVKRLNPFVSKSNNSGSTISSHYNNKQFVPCSYSPYDMQLPAASPRRRLDTIEARPNRLSLAPSKNRVRLEAHCFPGELPADAGPCRATSADFPAAAAAAALPDFVQDHWMDSWYASEMHLNSPPNSPVCDFMQDLPVERGVAGGGGSNDGNMGAAATGNSAAAASSASSLDVANALQTDESDPPTQRLPDFLSDGPIIHSSQRLADVAAGLPSNLMNSPEEVALKQQLSSLRIENDRQRRELNEARTALAEQTRRANELERQLFELERKNMENIKTSETRNKSQTEENLEQAKLWQGLALEHARKLKQQVKRLTTEVNCLRRENESLRGGGAVGGCSSTSSTTSATTTGSNTNCDRQCASKPTAAAAPPANSAGGCAVGNAIRPSRTQQISRDLLRAAANAENNLRQLLSGVDNLRQMASDIEQADLRLEYDISPDLFSDFPDERDDYEEYPGGPAL